MDDATTILIVDDYPASRYALGRMMRQQGYETVEIDSGGALLATLEAHRIDLVLMDVHLPDADGFELCNQLRADPRYERIPVIVVSATYASPDHRDRAESVGADAYFEQPVLAEQLGAEVERLLAQRSASPATG